MKAKRKHGKRVERMAPHNVRIFFNSTLWFCWRWIGGTVFKQDQGSCCETTAVMAKSSFVAGGRALVRRRHDFVLRLLGFIGVLIGFQGWALGLK
jgi:hypothetical protein